jgi:hypothetical protein
MMKVMTNLGWGREVMVGNGIDIFLVAEEMIEIIVVGGSEEIIVVGGLGHIFRIFTHAWQCNPGGYCCHIRKRCCPCLRGEVHTDGAGGSFIWSHVDGVNRTSCVSTKVCGFVRNGRGAAVVGSGIWNVSNE